MNVAVVGGVYRERCLHPNWDEVYGSAGRAAQALASLDVDVQLVSYVDDGAKQVLRERNVWLDRPIDVLPHAIERVVEFNYVHDSARPDIVGVPAPKLSPLRVDADRVVRFGMLEADAVVRARMCVYDPQNADDVRGFVENGSTAERLAIVLNAHEAGQLAAMPGERPEVMAPIVARSQGAEVVVVKRGPEGAFVWTPDEVAQVPAFRTERVWKVGSGDCFVAHFAHAWMVEARTPADAALVASRATAYYCDTRGLPTRQQLLDAAYEPVDVSPALLSRVRPKVYLAGPFFDLSQIWMVDQARRNLGQMGLDVFSPLHDVGRGDAEMVVPKDLEAIATCDLVLALVDGLDAGTVFEVGHARALGKPVIVYSERHEGESLKMMKGSGCILCSEYTTALYRTLWEAVKA